MRNWLGSMLKFRRLLLVTNERTEEGNGQNARFFKVLFRDR
jgi:hypothetical protein